MEQFNRLLLDVWREACRHIEIAEAIDLIVPLLVRQLPLDRLLVRTIDLERASLSTMAATSKDPSRSPPHVRTECSIDTVDQLMQWCRRGKILRSKTHALRGCFANLISADTVGEILAGPLNLHDGPPGILIAVAEGENVFQVEHEQLFSVLLEPFTVALENDRRLRELVALREKVEAENRSLRNKLGRNDLADAVVGVESGLRGVMERVNLVSRADIPVLILGETGSGKEVIARAIHKQSRRADGPFLRVNCGAIAPELVDSELFGHERGSFTGATALRKGWFERADRGTLFLDECGELTPAAQVRLLRILQDGTFERVGGERQIHVDVRVVAATHRDLQSMVAEGSFREDLWYRLAVFPIELPPLRDRPEDIPALAAHFALRAAKRFGLAACTPTPSDVNLLAAYPWPGNVRELAAVIERAAILGDGKGLDVVTALGVAAANDTSPTTTPSTQAHSTHGDSFASLDDAVRQHIEAALSHTQGRIEGSRGAAKLLGINPHTLRARMRKLGIEWSRFRS